MIPKMRWRPLRPLVAAAAALLVHSHAAGAELLPLPHQPSGIEYPGESWPTAELPEGLDRASFDATLESAFAARGRGGQADTRAVLVIHRGSLVFERYADGFGAQTRFHSWSMAKSVTNAVVGILVGMGRLDIDGPANISAWHAANDPRAAITLRQMLQMTPGTDNADAFDAQPDSLISRMMFGDKVGYMAKYAADVELAHPPGTHWAYSTGTSNIIADIAGREIGGGRSEMLTFMRENLFDPIGMKSAVPEFDKEGRFIGGAQFYASAQDYGRFGLLYLRDGVWRQQRILPEGWVDFSRSLAPAENNGNYAAHFWLSLPPAGSQFPSLVDAPPSTFSANGNEGQFIAMVPSHDLIVVRLGTLHATSWPDVSAYVSALINAFPAMNAAPAAEAR